MLHPFFPDPVDDVQLIVLFAWYVIIIKDGGQLLHDVADCHEGVDMRLDGERGGAARIAVHGRIEGKS